MSSSDLASPGSWAVLRIDDNGNGFVIRERLTRGDAERLVAEFEARGHKQVYWAEQLPAKAAAPTGSSADPRS